MGRFLIDEMHAQQGSNGIIGNGGSRSKVYIAVLRVAHLLASCLHHVCVWVGAQLPAEYLLHLFDWRYWVRSSGK
jgi:hypothetical protein